MKSFPAGFAAEKNKKTGISPVWFLRLTVAGVDYWISDTVFTIAAWNGGVTTLPWVSRWGQVMEGISGTLGEIRVADFDLDLLADPDASPNSFDLATGGVLEKEPAELYFWLRGLDAATDPPQLFLKGRIRELSLPDEATVSLVVEDETVRLQQRIGTRIDSTSHPEADPDDIGKLVPIIYGSVKKLPALAVEAGARTTLPAGITAATTSFAVSDATGLAASDVVQVDDEQIRINSISGDTFTSVTRGYNATAAVAHDKGSVAWEKRSTFVYLVADHPVDSVGKVWVQIGEDRLDATSLATIYTGQPGDEHSSYPGQAVVTLTDRVTASLTVSLDTDDQIAVNDVNHAHAGDTVATVCPSDDIVAESGSWFISADYAIDGNLNSGGVIENRASHADTVFKRTQPFSVSGTPTRRRWVIVTGDPTYDNGLKVNTFTTIAGSTTKKTTYMSWYAVNSWNDLVGLSISIGGDGGRCRVWEIWLEVEYTTGTVSQLSGVTKSGTVNLVGNSVANTLVGDALLVDVTRARTVAQVFDDLLSRVGQPAVTVTGSLPGDYGINGAITEYREALYWLDLLAFQLRSYFRMAPSGPKLTVRPDALASDKTIPSCRIDGSGRKVLSRRKADLSEVVNRIQLLFDRDRTKAAGEDAYQGISSGSDAASITDYGERERTDLFMMDFVTSQAMADSLQAFYLAQHAGRPWIYEFDLFLDHCELEFADGVTLGFLASQLVEVQEVRFTPGDVENMDVVRLVVKG